MSTGRHLTGPARPPVPLVGDGTPCRASTAATPLPVARRRRVDRRTDRCWPGARSSCRGTRASTAAPATSPSLPPPRTRTPGRRPGLRRPRRDGDDIAIICRNTTEAINHLAYRLRLDPGDVVVTTVVEHHANLLPWARAAACRFVECGRDGTFGADDVAAALDGARRPAARDHRRIERHRLVAAARRDHRRRPRPRRPRLRRRRPAGAPPPAACHGRFRGLERPQDVRPVRGGRPRRARASASPMGTRSSPEAGPSTWSTSTRWRGPTRPSGRRPGSPNVIGAVALHAAIDALGEIGWPASSTHEPPSRARLRRGLAAIDGVRLLGPACTPTRCRSPPSRSRACRTPWWRPG